MFTSAAPAHPLASSAPSTSSAGIIAASSDTTQHPQQQGGIFWSAPSQSMQPTAILQRPPPPPTATGPPAHLSQLAPPGQAPVAGEFATGDYSQIFDWVSQLLKGPEGREKALLELSRKREQYEDLALILWHSFGTVPCPLSLPVVVFSVGSFMVTGLSGD